MHGACIRAACRPIDPGFVGDASCLARNQEIPMPLVNVKLIEGVFDTAQKEEMITKLTDTMVAIEGENMRGVTWVVIEEVKSGQWGIGGRPLATADVKALAAGATLG
jgi:4-oxalocrotonate tautomerase